MASNNGDEPEYAIPDLDYRPSSHPVYTRDLVEYRIAAANAKILKQHRPLSQNTGTLNPVFCDSDASEAGSSHQVAPKKTTTPPSRKVSDNTYATSPGEHYVAPRKSRSSATKSPKRSSSSIGPLPLNSPSLPNGSTLPNGSPLSNGSPMQNVIHVKRDSPYRKHSAAPRKPPRASIGGRQIPDYYSSPPNRSNMSPSPDERRFEEGSDQTDYYSSPPRRDNVINSTHPLGSVITSANELVPIYREPKLKHYHGDGCDSNNEEDNNNGSDNDSIKKLQLEDSYTRKSSAERQKSPDSLLRQKILAKEGYYNSPREAEYCVPSNVEKLSPKPKERKKSSKEVSFDEEQLAANRTRSLPLPERKRSTFKLANMNDDAIY